MKISEITARLTKHDDIESGETEVGTYISDKNNTTNKIIRLPLSKIKSRFEGDDKSDPKWTDARENIESIKKQIKYDISKIPPIIVRRLPKENTYQVLDGHHRFFAFKEMNIKTIRVIVLKSNQITGDKYK